MTNIQKEKIDTMREKGRTFKDISLALGIPETTVKSYCYRKKPQQSIFDDNHFAMLNFQDRLLFGLYFFKL